MAWSYLDLADFLLIAEAVPGVPAEELADMPRVVQVAASALAVPSAGWGEAEALPWATGTRDEPGQTRWGVFTPNATPRCSRTTR